MVKENIDELQRINLVQTGDNVKKGDRIGQVIKVKDNDVLVMYADGTFKNEPANTLTPVIESVFQSYMIGEKRI